jgi:hypothetical protein
MKYQFLSLLSDSAIMGQHRVFMRVKSIPHGYVRFPNGAEKLAALELIIEQRIPADHIEQIQKLQLYINSKT